MRKIGMFEKSTLLTVVLNFAIPVTIMSIFFLIMFIQLVRQHLPFFGILAMIMYVLGFILFLIAKISVIKDTKIVSFGTKHMSNKQKHQYFTGYSLMAAGILLQVLVLLIAKI